MPGKVPLPNPPEVRLEAVRLVHVGGVSLKDAAATAGCSVQTMRNWVLRPGVTTGCATTFPPPTRTPELAQLRHRIRVLEQEKEILKRTAARFAKRRTRPHST